MALQVINLGRNVPRDLPRPDATQARLGTRVTGDFGAYLFDELAGSARKDATFTFPILAGIREVDDNDLTPVAWYAYRPDRPANLPLLEATVSYVVEWADRNCFVSERGRRGVQFDANRLTTDTLSLLAVANIPINAAWMVSPGLTWAQTNR
ncbi:MAG: hypothetical protein AAGC86_09785 [Pseudomonadota bacterium]